MHYACTMFSISMYNVCTMYVLCVYCVLCKNYVCMHYLCTMLCTMYGLFTNISNMFSILTILIKELLRKTKMFCISNLTGLISNLTGLISNLTGLISNLTGLILLFSFLWFNPKL